MSVSGTTSSKQSLIELLKIKDKKTESNENPIIDEEGIVSLIKKKKVDLHEVEMGLSAIHWAAITGRALVFNALVEKGVDPFLPSEDGFSPNYYARVHKKTEISKIFEMQFPVILTNDNNTSLAQEINSMLLDCGFHGFPILPIEKTPELSKKGSLPLSDDQKLTHFLGQIFKDNRLDFEKEKSSRVATKSKKITLKYISSDFLSQIAFGLVEQASPAKILQVLNQLYPTFSWRAKLSCIYLIKEMLRHANGAESFLTDDFKRELTIFTQHKREALALEALKLKLNQFYQSKYQLPAAACLSFDLLKAFTQVALQLSPDHFLFKKMSSKLEDTPFIAFSALSNKITHAVCMDILSAPTLIECASRIAFYIDVIKFCLKEDENIGLIPNFAAASAIYNALSMYSVSRLQQACLLALPQHRKGLAEFDHLLNGLDNFAGISKLMSANAKCIPLISLYSAQKDKIAEKDMASSIEAFGKLNQQFEENRNFLASLTHVHKMHYRTNFMSRAQSMKFVEKAAEWYSFSLEPLRVIDLDSAKTSEAFLTPLKYCADLQGPLVVRQNQKEFQGHQARKVIEIFLGTKQFLEIEKREDKKVEILGLCDKIIIMFESNNPTFNKSLQIAPTQSTSLNKRTAKKIPKFQRREPKPSPSTLEEHLAALKLDESSHSSQGIKLDYGDMIVEDDEYPLSDDDIDEKQPRDRANTTIGTLYTHRRSSHHRSSHHRHSSKRSPRRKDREEKLNMTSPQLLSDAEHAPLLIMTPNYTPMAQTQASSSPLYLTQLDSKQASSSDKKQDDVAKDDKSKMSKVSKK